MPRSARKMSESGIYHIMLRGINRQIIFEDEEDSQTFVDTVGIYKKATGCEIYAYCLMKNHVHLVVKAEREKLGRLMRKIGSKYVFWYNWKYNRVGGLFQDRYKSEPVENDSYFLTVVRYIHQNPVKAGICKSIEDYEMSSYKSYLAAEGDKLVDTEFLLRMIDKRRYVEFHKEKNNDICLEINEIVRINDNQAKAIIIELCKCKNATDFQQLEANKRNKYIKKLKEKGLSVRQIERLTGINRGIVLKA